MDVLFFRAYEAIKNQILRQFLYDVFVEKCNALLSASR